MPRIGIYDAGCIFAQKRDKVKTLSLFWAQKAGLVRSEATEQRSLQSRHKRAAWQGADRVTLFRRSRFRSRKARCPQTAFAVCPKRQKAKARHTGRRALRLAQKAGFYYIQYICFIGYKKRNILYILKISNILVIFYIIFFTISCLSDSYKCPYVLMT